MVVKLADDVLLEVGGPLYGVEKALQAAVSATTGPAVQQVLTHLVASGGKRVRPVLTLLSAKLFASDIAAAVPVAAAAELIHMATLMHDDVIDAGSMRRGRPTANRIWGNHVAVLAGDALLARALVLLVDAGNPQVVEAMARMIHCMCEGEIEQSVSLNDLGQTEAAYFARIEKKTALFFATCCEAGALVVGASKPQAAAMREYGRLIGLAFQVTDDLLDISAEAAAVGKPVGRDLMSGVLTLPLIHALHHPVSGPDIRARVSRPPLSDSDLEQVLTWVRSDGAIDHTKRVATSLAKQAQGALPEVANGAVHRALLELADLVVERSS